MKINLILAIFLLATFSCQSNKNAGNSSESQNKPVIENSHVYPPDTVVLNFLAWYRDNFEKMNPFYMVSDKNDSMHIISGKWGDSTSYFSLNIKGTEKFLKFLNSSKCLSKNFLENKRKTFLQRGKVLTKEKQWDGPPIGFSAEEIFYMNDIEEYFPKIKNAKILDLSIKGDSASCKVNTFEHVRFHLSKYNNLWLIDDIEFLNEME